MAARQPALFQIPLMVILGAPEGLRRNYLRHDLFRLEAAFGVKRFNLRLRLGLLLRRVEKDRGAVLRSPVRPLAIHRGRVVKLEKRVQKLPVADLFRIEVDFYDFDMGRLPTSRLSSLWADILVTGVFLASAFIPHGSSRHAGHRGKCSLNAPETANPKRSFLCVHIWLDVPSSATVRAWARAAAPRARFGPRFEPRFRPRLEARL